MDIRQVVESSGTPAEKTIAIQQKNSIFAARFRQTVAGRESRREESRDSTEHHTS